MSEAAEEARGDGADAVEAVAPVVPAGPVELDVEHETHYEYGSAVEQAHHLAYLRPCQDAHQQLQDHHLSIQPQPASRHVQCDVYGNTRTCFSLAEPHAELRVTAHSRVSLTPRHAGFDPARTPPWEQVRERLAFRAGGVFEPAAEFSFASPFVPMHAELRAYARASFRPGRSLGEAAVELMRRIHRDFRYDSASTEISTPVLEAFEQRVGVCQDFAHVMIGCLRALGLAARYISGYLLTEPLPGQPRLVGADASHAWVAVWCPVLDAEGTEQGEPVWLELDPTNDCLAETRHVRLAVGRDYGDVTPLRGVIRGGGKHTLVVRVTTRPVETTV
ncbi:MAG: transglutaminase family protein [Aquabacterium sp.]|jgi:transglutaminase-like putative cysteine protease|nr:MAG: transglutaminase family protein [Aquabacterium sp.]